MAVKRFFGKRHFKSPFQIKEGEIVEFGYNNLKGEHGTRRGIVISPEFDYPNGVVMGVILIDELPDNDFLSLVESPVYEKKYSEYFRSFFLKGAMALQVIDVILPTDTDVDITIKPDRYFTFEELDAIAVKRYVWMANRQGGQISGNKTVIVNITEDVYYNFIRKITRAKYRNYKEFIKFNKNSYALFTSIQGTLPPSFISFGSLTKLAPAPRDPRWVKEVRDFTSREALEHRMSYDDELENLYE